VYRRDFLTPPFFTVLLKYLILLVALTNIILVRDGIASVTNSKVIVCMSMTQVASLNIAQGFEGIEMKIFSVTCCALILLF